MKILEDSLTCTRRLPSEIVINSCSIWRDYSSLDWQFDIVTATETRGSCTRFLLRSNKGTNNDQTLLSSDYNTIYTLLLSVAFLLIWFQTNLRSCTLTPFHCIVTHFTSYYIGKFNTSKDFFLALQGIHQVKYVL